MKNKSLLTFIRLAFILLLAINTCFLKAQTTASSTKILDVVTSQTCECLTKQKDEIKTKQQFETALGVCMMQAAADKLEGLTKELGLKEFNVQAGRKLGEKVGYKLAATCPEFIALSVKLYGVDTKTDNVDSVSTIVNEFVGIVKKINKEGYVTITAANAAGKESNFVWIEYFKGSDKYKADLQKLIGEKVTIAWKEKEIFNANLKDYISIKEITGLEKN